jgi:hypothetical protein
MGITQINRSKDAPWVKQLLIGAYTILNYTKTVPITSILGRPVCILLWVMWAVIQAGKIDYHITVTGYGCKDHVVVSRL